MLFGPLLPSLFPSELTALFSFQPFVFPDLLLDQVGDPIERIRHHHRRDLNVLLGFEDLTHRDRWQGWLADHSFRFGVEKEYFAGIDVHGQRLPLME